MYLCDYCLNYVQILFCTCIVYVLIITPFEKYIYLAMLVLFFDPLTHTHTQKNKQSTQHTDLSYVSRLQKQSMAFFSADAI